MAKLFSFEDQELAQAGADVELDSSAEEGAAAQVVQEMAEDHEEIAQLDSGVQEGTAAAAQLEAVQAGVQATVVSGEGLTEQSAEGYRLAVESIALMVGAPKKSVYALYSTENFGSTSSRMANTRISLEGIGDFLKALWERIKAAVKSVIEKVKAFYAKHLSGLGRVTKALESMKKKITDTKGTVKTQRVPAPGSLKTAFPTSTNLLTSDVEKYLTVHVDASEAIVNSAFAAVITLTDDAKTTMKAGTVADIKTASKALIDAVAVSGKDTPFVGGAYAEYDIQADSIDNLTLSFKEVETKLDDKAEMSVASKAEMSSLVTKAIAMIVTTKKFSVAVEKFSKDFDTKSKELEKQFTDIEVAQKAATEGVDKTAKEEGLKESRKVLTFIGKVGSSVPTLSAKMTSLNVKVAFAVVSYCKFNLAQYK